jgi:hypothetical protein
MSVSCVCCVCCEGSCLCDELITRPEESYRLCASVYDLETLTLRRPRSGLDICAKGKNEIRRRLVSLAYIARIRKLKWMRNLASGNHSELAMCSYELFSHNDL